MNEKTVKRPGTELMKVGALLAAVGVLLWMVAAMNGGNAVPLWISAAGALLAIIGFGQRILAALEDKPRTSDNLRVNGTHAE